MTERLRYLAFMLRLWQVEADGAPIWRASLENPHTSERRGFASVEALFEFLRSTLGSPDPHFSQSQNLAMPESRAEAEILAQGSEKPD